ncbi:MAG: hypothetical protein C0502_06405 [Opitutus sp.]|nr:hypothetical protein [Opitutus sp.]
MSAASAPVALPGPLALRALARAFSQFENFDRFVAALDAVVPRASGFETARLVLDRAVVAEAERFAPGLLALPLTGDDQALGTLEVGVPGERRGFTAEDLHLLTGLADFLGAVLTQAQRQQDAARGRELFRLLLNQAPVGIAAYTAAGRALVANDLAERWLGGTTPPFDELEAGGDGGFHLRTSGKLVYGVARRVGDAARSDWLVVLHDLTGEQVKLLELMKRDTYRALAEQRPLGFALVEGGSGGDGVLRRLPALRAALREGETVGPYDAHRLGFVLGGVGGLGLRARLREWRALLGPGVKLGYAELGRDGRSPEALLQVALQHHAASDEALRPAVLVLDENPVVAQTLALILGRDYRVVTSTAAAEARARLAAEPFEFFIAEVEPRNGPAGAELVREAGRLQPGIRSLLTAIGDTPLAAAPGATVIEKPFDVATLRSLLRQ